MDQTNSSNRIQTICLLILTIIAVAFALFFLRPVMIPFVLAIIFTLILSPIVDFQTKTFKAPRMLAILTTLIVGFLILGVLWLLVSASVNQMANNADSYQQHIIQLIDKATSKIDLEKFGLNSQQIKEPLIQKAGNNVGSILGNILNAIIRLMSKSLLVTIFVIFLLIGRRKVPIPSSSVYAEGESRVKKYIIAKATLSAITGILVGGILTILGIDLALVFGLFAFILNFIPSIGSIIATLLPVPVVLVSPDISFTIAMLAIFLPGGIQFLIGNVIEPKIMGDSLDLHPVAILMALIFWGMIWGVVGMLLAAPLTAIMKIIFERIEFTKSFANLLAGRIE